MGGRRGGGEVRRGAVICRGQRAAEAGESKRTHGTALTGDVATDEPSAAVVAVRGGESNGVSLERERESGDHPLLGSRSDQLEKVAVPVLMLDGRSGSAGAPWSPEEAVAGLVAGWMPVVVEEDDSAALVAPPPPPC